MSLNLDKVGIIYNPDISNAECTAFRISKKFEGSELYSSNEMPDSDISFAVVVGGDGTILKTARKYAPADVPIFGINMGRLGFLAQARPEDIDYVVEQILDGNYRIEDRVMLECIVDNKSEIALNDIVMRGAPFSRVTTLELFINNNPTASYLADGLIVATPTGSTAYSLSAGGPIISPIIECFTIVAICPHTLTVRPLVVPATERLMIRPDSRGKFQLTVDGQDVVGTPKEVTIQKYSKTAKLLLLDKEADVFYRVLRDKLGWGRAPEGLYKR
jgi:NAD+ kinase